MQKAISDNNNPAATFLSNNSKTDLAEILATLIENKWLIASSTVLLLALGIGKAFIDTPIFQTDALVQVEVNAMSLSPLEPDGPIVKNDIPVRAEIELINSRKVLGNVIKNLKLDIIAEPKYFPIFGKMVARRLEKQNRNKKNSDPLFDQNQYAWGGEAIKVDTFNIPSDLLDHPFILIAGKNGAFQLWYEENLILEGEAGKLASKQFGELPEPIMIFVSMLKARPDTRFTVIRQTESNTLSELKKNLHVAEKGKLTRLIELTLESSNPESAVRILNEIINIYLRQNVEQKSAEAQKTLEFLEKQMPLLKEQLDSATNALNDFRTKVGSIDLDIETQSLLEGVVKTKTEITLLQQKRDELREKFTESHPSVIALDKQIARLQDQVKAHDHNIGVLPETQQIILKLSRDVKVNTELYTTLLNNAQTLRVAKAGTVGDVRVIDYAELPNLPIKPRKKLIAGLSLLLGLVLGIALAYVRKALRSGVENPDLIESKLHIPVYATIPHSAEQEKLAKKISRTSRQKKAEPLILARQNRDDIAIESLRSLRTTLHFAFLEAQNNIIMITGPCPDIGKTFVSVNLASVLADAGKKILLIDGDLRKGYINKVLGIGRGHGLSELISTSNTNWMSLLDLVVHKIPSVNFDFISTGVLPPNPSELLLHERFGKLLKSISANYDQVIIDSPPILAVTDASIIGQLASATLMVVKAGQHPMRELEDSVKRLAQSGVQLKGIVFNDLPPASSRFEYHYGYNQYVDQYRPQKAR